MCPQNLRRHTLPMMHDHFNQHSIKFSIPYPWIPDIIIISFFFLQMLASHFLWMHEILERLGKDGKEAAWRTIGEGVAPETNELTEGLGHR